VPPWPNSNEQKTAKTASNRKRITKEPPRKEALNCWPSIFQGVFHVKRKYAIW
jgi:hypothetical protein